MTGLVVCFLSTAGLFPCSIEYFRAGFLCVNESYFQSFPFHGRKGFCGTDDRPGGTDDRPGSYTLSVLAEVPVRKPDLDFTLIKSRFVTQVKAAA